MKNLSPNIIKYYIWRFLNGFYFIYALQAIYLLSKGITPIQLGLFASSTTLFITVLEIPTGFIADKFSRRASVSLGFFISSLAFLGLIFVSNFYSLLIISFLMGLAAALKSGATESLIYDDLKNSASESDYLKVSSRGSTLGTIAGGLASFVGPLLYVINTSIPFLLTAIPHLFLAFYILRFDEQKKPNEVGNEIKIFDGVKSIIKNRRVRLLLLMDILLLTIIIIFYQTLYAPKINSLGLDIKYLGVLDTINLGLMSALLVVLPKIVFKNRNYSLILYSLLPITAFILFGLTNSLAFSIAFGIIFDLSWTARNHIVPTILNEYFSSKDRALSLSSSSFISGLGAAILVPIALVIFKISYLFAIVPALIVILMLFIYTRTQTYDTNSAASN